MLVPLRAAFWAVLVSLVSAQCDRHELEVGASRYLATLSTGDVGWLQTVLADNATYSENLALADLHSSLARPLRVDYSRTTVDTTQCATFSEILATDPRDPKMIATQLRFGGGSGKNTSTTGHKRRETSRELITSISSIVTTDGDLLFNASHALHYYLVDRADWTRPLPVAERDSRAVLQAAADAYYDVFVNKSVSVPWGSPCTRVEGGFLDANGSCAADVPDVDVGTHDRRYVIDEAVGSVNVVANFGILGPDSHEFRVVGGKIRSIHAMTLCRPNPDCGLAIPDLLTQDVGY